MNEHVNPFLNILEAVGVLKNLGADPFKAKKVEPEESIYWQEHILSVVSHRIYKEVGYSYRTEIHIDSEGFDHVCTLMAAPIVVTEEYAEDYDIYYVEPTPSLRLFSLKPKDKEVHT